MGLLERRRREAASRWKPNADVEDSGGASFGDVQRGIRAVCEGKFLILSLQKQGVDEGWTPGPAGRVAASGSLRAKDSTIKRTNGHGSMLASEC